MIRKTLEYLRIRLATSSESRAKIYRKRGVKIGKNPWIHYSVGFSSEPYLIELGDDVRLTAGVQFITHDGGMWVLRNLSLLRDADLFGKIVVGNNVHVGINTVIMPGVTIGDNVLIGVGAVVTNDIPSNSVAVGVPARVIKTIDEYYEKNKERVDFTKKMGATEKKVYLLKKFGMSYKG